MSEQKSVTEEKVVLNFDDMVNMVNYGKFFGVPLTDELVKATDIFKADPSYLNQKEFLRAICHWMLECEHETFKDPLWDKPKETARKILPELDADKEIQRLIVEG